MTTSGHRFQKADLHALSSAHRDAKALQWERAVRAVRQNNELEVKDLRERFGCSKQWAQRVIREALRER